MSHKSCKGCKKRKVGCHSTCPDYAEQQEENKRRRKQEDYYKLLNSRTPTNAQQPNRNKREGRWKNGTD